MSREQESCVQSAERINRIATMNDALRKLGVGGAIGVTRAVTRIPGFDAKALLAMLAAFDDFTPDNDPHGERDFGKIEFAGERLFWKIDYFDRKMEFHSPDAANPDVTERMLTVMLASEY